MMENPPVNDIGAAVVALENAATLFIRNTNQNSK